MTTPGAGKTLRRWTGVIGRTKGPASEGTALEGPAARKLSLSVSGLILGLQVTGPTHKGPGDSDDSFLTSFMEDDADSCTDVLVEREWEGEPR